MIENGFVLLIQTGLADATIPGGFPCGQLPKDLISVTTPKAWTYRSIVSEPLYHLTGQDGLTRWHVQIDSHGMTAADAFTLARAIEGVLRGSYSGTLTDSDRTVVTGIFRLPGLVDGFSDANHTYVRSLEYDVQYYQI